MSESEKMGLFGSKDENPEPKDDNKDPEKVNTEASNRRNAPYNIDSDSDTYDTEALSIMDINDIIGIQADSAGDSTLESEFAALTEVITDIKSDEINLENITKKDIKDTQDSGIGMSDRDRNIDSQKDKGSRKDSSKDGSQTDEKKFAETAGMAEINKSLRLIGEAYDSDDSQDTDNEEISICLEKTVNLDETVKATTSKDSGVIVTSTDNKITHEKECPIELEKSIASDKSVETVEKSTTEHVKSVEIEKSVDSTDSPSTVVLTKRTRQNEEENKTQGMDVDSKLASDVRESDIDKSPCNKSSKIEAVVKIIENSKTDLVVVESVIDGEEAMEVDEPIIDDASAKIEKSEKTDSFATKEAVTTDNKLPPSNLVVATEAETVIEPESEQSTGNINLFDNTQHSRESEMNKKSPDDQVSKAASSSFAVEDVKDSKIDENNSTKESSICSKNKDIIGEKLEMETDDAEVEESLEVKIQVKNPVSKVVKSILSTIEEVCQEAVDDDDDKANNLPTETNVVEQQRISKSLEQVGEISEQNITLAIERDEPLNNVPMEIDDNAGGGYRKNDSENDKESFNSPSLSSGNTVDIVEPLANIVESLKQQDASDEQVDIASDSRVSSSETLEIPKIEAVPDNSIEENANTDSKLVTCSALPVSSTKTDANIISEECATEAPEISLQNIESSLVDTWEENANDKRDLSDITASVTEPMETEDITLKESSTEEVVEFASESSKKLSKIQDNIPDVITRERSVVATGEIPLEDEKMEVDSGAKRYKENEKSDSCGPDDATKETDEFSVFRVTSNKVYPVEEKPAVKKPDDSAERKDSGRAEKTVEVTLEIPNESMTVKSSEAEAATESIDETDEAKHSLQDKPSLISIQKTESLKEESNLEIADADTSSIVSPVEAAAAENETESELKKEKILSEKSESSKTPVEAIEESTEDKEKSTETESIESKPSISTTIIESSTETTEESDSIEENVTKADTKTQPEAKDKEEEEEETAILTTVEAWESLNKSSKIKEPEASLVPTEKSSRVEDDESSETAAKKSLVSIEKIEPSSVTSSIEVTENIEEENDSAKTETKKTLVSIDIDIGKRKCEEIESSELADEDFQVAKVKEREESTSVSTEATVEIEHEKSERDASTVEVRVTESQFEFSKPVIPQQETIRRDLSSCSINPEDVEGEEDPVEEEMNLSLDPDIGECQESADEETREIGELSLEEIGANADEIAEDQVEINLRSVDREEKTEEPSSSRGQVSGVKTKQSDEHLEKLEEMIEEDDEDNSKDIIPSMSSGREIFHDEQSQNTQEMMDSILETDSSNFNKVLDDEEAHIDELAAKLPSSESEEMLNKALDDPMASQNIDSLEGLLDLDLIQEGDESTMKSVEPIVAKVVNDDDIETKDVDVSLLLGETDQGESVDRDDCVTTSVEADRAKIISEDVEKLKRCEKIAVTCENLSSNTAVNETIDSPSQLDAASSILVDNEVDVEAVELTSGESKLDFSEQEVLREIDEERKIAENILLEIRMEEGEKSSEENILSRTALQEKANVSTTDVLLSAAVVGVESSGLDLVQDILMENPIAGDIIPEKVIIHDQVLTAAAEIEDLPPISEISELESAVKFLQQSEEQEIGSPLVLTPKLVETATTVDEIVGEDDVALFVTDAHICADPSVLVAELESIIPDPIAISEAEIISEAAKLENERKTKLTEEAKLESPVSTSTNEGRKEENVKSTSLRSEVPKAPVSTVTPHPETTSKNHAKETCETTAKSPIGEKIQEMVLLKKSAPIPKISILEERLKEPPKIEIPQSVGEVSRMCEMPTTPKTSLLIQRDAKLSNFPTMLESPKASDRSEHKILDTPRKDMDKHDFENVGSPRIILKIAKSAIADCGEPRSPKSPKIRSATNSPNPEDSPGQKLGKIKLKLSKGGGHPSIILNENVEEVCGQWHTEGTSSLSPLGMKIKFSKIADTSSIVQSDKHEEDTRPEPTKNKFEEAKRTESPIGMKIKFSKTGDPSIVQQDIKESTSKHKDKIETVQGSPKRNESPIGMKIKFSKSGDASIIQPEKSESLEDDREAGGSSRGKDKLDVSQDTPRRTESPLGIKFKLFKTGDASIVGSEIADDSSQETKRTDSPLGMKIKLSKTSRGSASIVATESSEDFKERHEAALQVPRSRTESPLGMKIKFTKTGDASIITHLEEVKETAKHKDRGETSREIPVQGPETSLGVKINKVSKTRDTASSLQADITEDSESVAPVVEKKRVESSIGMKFKLSKTGDASIVHSEKLVHDSKGKEKPEIAQETTRKPDVAAIGVKIKFSKTGDASIIKSQATKKQVEESLESEIERQRSSGEVALPLKIKLQKSTGDAAIVETEKKEKSTRRKETDSPLEMKIKLSKTGHPTIIACETYGESSQRGKESSAENPSAQSTKHKDSTSSQKEIPGMKMLKSMHGNVTIEPVQQARKSESVSEVSSKRKDVTISPIESKKAKLEAHLSQMLPEVTIQPIKPREPKQTGFDAKASSISRQQMNVISQEISITQVRSNKAMDLLITDKFKSLLAKNPKNASGNNTDCEIIEHRPELIIVNENSNSSQDVMIIEEVPALRGPDAKVPKKRGRPRRNPLPLVIAKPAQHLIITGESPKDPLALDDLPHLNVPQIVSQNLTQIVPQRLPPKENERPKRTCSRQKSYAPPKRGRGRGRGKRKLEMDHMELSKKPRIEQDLDMIEESTTALITIDDSASETTISQNTSELYKALRQPPMDHKMANAIARVEAEQAVNDADLLAKDTREALMDSRIMSHLDGVLENSMKKPSVESESFEPERKISLESICNSVSETSTTNETNIVNEEMDKSELMIVDVKTCDKISDEAKDNKDTGSNTQDHQNWLTPSSKKILDGKNEGNISNVQAIDEETRMSAESSSRSQTPAKNMSLQAPETIVNEESQGSVLSTATTESEKVKVKNRRMEISFDPDEGPFTVDKVAEYEWPPDPTRKGETFMIQEQISQYLGVKSFKRKYPDLKRRMVDMEERNFLRENGLVSEAMCDMGLTAVSSSEVLDIMCNDFPDQYEEYRKYIREKQMKEHSKKQKELTAAANAERNRIDLAEMAVQSALSWNVGLNKARRESRKCSLDLQTFTIHVPKKQQKVEQQSRQSNYPVALIPGQYTDYYREYTPAELRYYPLNTVLYGPMKPNERKLDSQSEGSQSDSDSDSSSDDSSSSSSDGTQDTEESQSTMDEVDVELSRQKEDIKNIKCKMCLKHLNKFNRIEVLIQCGTCNGYVHPSCIDLTLDMVPHIQAYAWQCTDCKTCAQCHDPADEDKMLFCDMCDRGYHIYCVGLRRVPQGRWHCQECAVCASCGSREAGGTNSDRNSVAQWQHEYKKGDKNTRVYVSTLCVPCSKLWRKGRYCPHCSRCHTVPRLDLEASLVHCSACDKYLHLGCVETKDLTIGRKNYLCDFCQPNRQQIAKPLVSKVFRT